MNYRPMMTVITGALAAWLALLFSVIDQRGIPSKTLAVWHTRSQKAWRTGSRSYHTMDHALVTWLIL